MTYLDYLNRFNQWLESNPLPGNAQLLYFRLLNVFNRAGWPEQVRVDTLRLMLMTDCQRDAAYRARDRLRDAGFISYEKGKKGAPTVYFLSDKTTENAIESATENAIENATESATENATHNKNKIKNKKKKDPPIPPNAAELGFGPELTEAFQDWLAYKQERREMYKSTGLKNLIAQVRKHAELYGESAVADLIRVCMSSNWRGIIWDRLSKQAAHDSADSSDNAWEYV